jgi:fused signal recognition particle receptor
MELMYFLTQIQQISLNEWMARHPWWTALALFVILLLAMQILRLLLPIEPKRDEHKQTDTQQPALTEAESLPIADMIVSEKLPSTEPEKSAITIPSSKRPSQAESTFVVSEPKISATPTQRASVDIATKQKVVAPKPTPDLIPKPVAISIQKPIGEPTTPTDDDLPLTTQDADTAAIISDDNDLASLAKEPERKPETAIAIPLDHDPRPEQREKTAQPVPTKLISERVVEQKARKKEPLPDDSVDLETLKRRQRSDELKARRQMHVSEVNLEDKAPADLAPRSLREGLEKTRKGWISRLNDLLRGKKELDSDIIDQLEEVLFTADIGTRTTQHLLQTIETKLERRELHSLETVKASIKQEIYNILSFGTQSLDFEAQKPYVIMIVGVNGVGKTTTIGKIAARLSKKGKKVLIAAADTFRAAAVEQLETWAARVDAEVLKGNQNQDPSSVVFDAIQAGLARKIDIILVDTAGRLHTKQNLMEELKKVKRIMGRAYTSAPHEVWLVLDATTGQNAINQAKQFNEALGVTGIILTKLDGTAKGGVVVAISEELKIPIRYIGVGEHIDELKPFSAGEFVDALF